jgi:uncharacterized membrane protein
MIEVTLFSRTDCHLCDQAKEQLDDLQSKVPHKLLVVDVDQKEQLRKKYGFEVPVVEIGPYTLRAPFTKTDLEVTLNAAADRIRQLEALDNAPEFSKVWTKSDSISLWLSRHYMALFNLFVFIYVGLPVLAPFLMAAGMEAPARLIYRGYGFVCHQLAYRSFFVLGEQYAYPRASAEVEGLRSFREVTGMSEESSYIAIDEARNFIGNPQLGYKMALCERDIAIYGAILLFGLLFVLTGRRIPPLHWTLWILLGLAPVGLDGLSQLFSQPPLDFLPAYRESTPFLRVLTGGLFGFMTAWFGYPMVEQSMRDSKEAMEYKKQRIERLQSE